MKALQITWPGAVDVLDIPVAEPQAGEVLVQVRAVNTCPQWDLHLWEGVPMFKTPVAYPCTVGQPGHEMEGTIVAVGADVDGLVLGDRVATWKDAGHARQGCYAEYVCFDPFHLLRIPKDAEVGAFTSLELAMCVGASFLDLLACTTISGKRVAVSGLGGAGLIAAQYAKAEGAVEVVGFETNPARWEFATQCGVDRVLNPVAHPREEPGAYVADLALDCVGCQASVEYLLKVTREIVAVFGVQREPYLFPCGNRHLKLFGYPGHSREAAEYARGKIADGLLDLRGLAPVSLSLTGYAEGIRLLREQKVLKVRLECPEA